MSSLRAAVGDYLAMRRALGFKLDREEKLLPQFAAADWRSAMKNGGVNDAIQFSCN